MSVRLSSSLPFVFVTICKQNPVSGHRSTRCLQAWPLVIVGQQALLEEDCSGPAPAGGSSGPGNQDSPVV